MGWAEKRIEAYQDGEDATWMERRSLEHANPVHLPLALVGAVIIGYGLWAHDRRWIGVGLRLNIIGHLYCWRQ
jgi:hypothetical protein